MGRERKASNRRWGTVMGISLLAAVGTGLLVGDYLTPDCESESCPAVDRLESYRPPEPAKIFDADGDLAGQLAGPRRIVVASDSIPALLKRGYVAVEDQRFYEHGGVDMVGAVRAFFTNIAAGGVEEGASTITMQLARNVFGEEVLDYNRWHRKATEIRLAREIENQLSKDEILTLYLNQIYLGDGVWGVETAARHYFGESLGELDLNQIALLIGLAKNPEGYDPRDYPEEAEARIDLVLGLMVEQGVITAEEAERARERDLALADEGQTSRWGPNAYYFNAVRRELREIFPDPGTRSGLSVYTGLDQRAQVAALEALREQLRAIEAGRWGSFRHDAPGDSMAPALGASPYLQGMVVAMEPASGLVTTLVGGRDYQHSEFDRAFLAERQPGSAFKPIVYAAAVAQGLRLSDDISTQPVRYAREYSEDWQPDDHVSEESLTVRDALVFSSNSAAVRVGQRVGTQRVARQAAAMGISTDIPDYPSIYLGAAEVIPAELVAAYAAFGNGGQRIEPHLIERVENAEGREIWRYTPEGGRALDAGVAFLVLDVLKDVTTRGTAWRVGRALSMPAAGKTGTTDDSKDLWFVGMTPSLVAGVWVGFDTPKTVVAGASGGELAAPVWAEFMKVASPGGMEAWPAPPGVTQARVDTRTGRLWNEFCLGSARSEYFLSGSEPAAQCRPEGPYWYRSAREGWTYDSTAAAMRWPEGPDSAGIYARDPQRYRTRFYEPSDDRDAWEERLRQGRERRLDSLKAARDSADGLDPLQQRNLDAARRNRGRIRPADTVGTGGLPDSTPPPPDTVVVPDTTPGQRPPPDTVGTTAGRPPPPDTSATVHRRRSPSDMGRGGLR